MFQQVPSTAKFPQLEDEIGQFWKERQIYEKSLANREGAPSFVFYEGPPTANGMPHPGHCLTRAIKDLFPRYRTMRGDRCERKGGWDTHGLPVEVEVCKELGIHSKEEIEAYGIEPFIQKCQESVWRYMQEWERLTERLGFWIHLDEAYVTYHQSYVESVWWSLKNLFNRGLLYQGHKIVWWWAQGGTALSAGEVGQGYREVGDPSVFVKFPLVDEPDTSLLVWTTTPWTLPSNQFAAVHPELEYSTVVDPQDGKKLIMASALVETIAGKVKRELTVESTCQGTDLFGKRYRPPFDFYYEKLKDAVGKLKPMKWTKESGVQNLDIDILGKWNINGLSHEALDKALYCLSDLRAERDYDFKYWRVTLAGFVTTESGTGIVHQAPAFGEVDYEVLVAEQSRFEEGEGPELINAVAPNGTFTAEAPDYQGRWVKDCDKDISRDLRERGLLFHLEQYLHDYPFCWRAEEDPLIQYPRESWFIRTTEFKDDMVANNQQINWLPEHIRDGRFGNFLASNVDWALSRERYWGTPLPIWVCDQTGKKEAIGNYDELLAKPGVTGMEVWEKAKAAKPEMPDDLRVHKPYIDAITYESPFADGGRMVRVTEVIDCWYDSGAMPFAQWGYPNTPGSAEQFESQFPADFISEALDQTRGWFYSQLAISTLLFGERKAESGKREEDGTRPHEFPHPFRNCIVLGLMLGEDGQKMSKSKRNYRAPDEIFDLYGADALRWYFFANQQPWTSIRYSEPAIKDSIPEFLLRLWNVYSFFVIYANIDGFDPAAEISGKVGQLNPETLAQAKTYRPASERRELDRWALSQLNELAQKVTASMDAYDNYGACQEILKYVDGLSNWFVRRSRGRFWSDDKQDPDKLDAYWTLYECLITVSKLVAPFVPHVAEAFWQNLAVSLFGTRTTESVHLCDFPTGDPRLIDHELSKLISLGREISSLGRSARTTASLKVRQPLARVVVILVDDTYREVLQQYHDLIAEELNVKEVEFSDDIDRYVSVSILPDFKRLGPRFGKQIPAIKKALGGVNGNEILAQYKTTGHYTLELPGGESIQLERDDIQARLQAKDGWTAAQGEQCVVVLATELTEELIQEGYSNDLIRVIQDRRKELKCEYTDRIAIGFKTEDAKLRAAIEAFAESIKQETLTIELTSGSLDGGESAEVTVSGHPLTLWVKVVA